VADGVLGGRLTVGARMPQARMLWAPMLRAQVPSARRPRVRGLWESPRATSPGPPS
jgi:hypothetical protein